MCDLNKNQKPNNKLHFIPALAFEVTVQRQEHSVSNQLVVAHINEIT